jgi:broad specificity phosphatase PhoE
MTKLILIRHGEPTYDYVGERKFIGHGRDLAQLTPKGVEQAKIAAKDIRLKGSQLIVASPYTRALQTAAIISKETGLDIQVELNLHEWLPDTTFQYSSSEESITASKSYIESRGRHPEGQVLKWEQQSSVAERVISCVKKYLNYEKIIIVSHGLVMEQLSPQAHIPHCGILEVDFDENFQSKGWVGL